MESRYRIRNPQPHDEEALGYETWQVIHLEGEDEAETIAECYDGLWANKILQALRWLEQAEGGVMKATQRQKPGTKTKGTPK